MASVPPSSTPAGSPPPPPAPKRKGPWLWLLLGCGGLLLVVALVVFGVSYFAVKKGKEFFDTAKKNPTVAAAKLIAAANPDIEVVSSDDEAGTVTIRNKKTGEVLTVNASEIKQGKLRFSNEKGQEVRIEQEGEGRVTISTEEGRFEVGEGVTELPAWVPLFPGAQGKGGGVFHSGKELRGSYAFAVSAPLEQVKGFYEKELKSGGFKVEASAVFEQGGEKLVILTAQAPKRKLTVTMSSKGGGTELGLAFEAADGAQ